MRPLSADHPSRAFTLFYIVFDLLVGGWHFASRYFHDLNLLSYQTLIIIIFTRMDKAKKKAKKVTKKVATPTFSADINLDQEEPDIPEKVEKVEVDQISIVKKVEGKGDVQPLVVVKEERFQPFVIEERQDISTIKSQKVGDGKVDQQVRVPIGLVQDIVRQDQVKPVIQEHALQQQRKEQQDKQLSPSEESNSHTYQPVHLASTTIEEKVELLPRQQPIQIQKEAEVKKIVLEDDEQNQLALSLKEDPKSKTKTTKKTTKKSKAKPKAAASAIFAVQDIVDLDDFNDIQEVKPKSQIIAHVEQKRQETINEIIEVKKSQLAKEQQEKPAEPEIITCKVSEGIVEAQFKQQPLEHVQPKNTTDPIGQQEPAQAIMQQDKYPQHIEHIEEPQVVKGQIAVKQETKVEVKEEIIPVRNIEQEVQSQIAFTLQDNKHKSKITKKNTKKAAKKPKVDKSKQLTDDNIFDVKEIQQNELPKPAQIRPQPHIHAVEKAQEPKQQQKVEEDIGVIEQKQEQIVPVFVQTEQKQEQGAQKLLQSKEKQEIQQTKAQIPIQEQRVEPEPTFTQQPVVIEQQKPIIEQPAPEPPKQETPVVKKEVEEEQEIQALSFADPLKPKTNKTTKKTTKKLKGKPKEEKNAVIGESMLNFDLEVVKNQQPQKQEEKIEKAEEIPSKPIEIAKNVQQQLRPQVNEKIVQQQPAYKIVEHPHVVPEKTFTKTIEKPQKPQPSPVLSSAPESKKEIVSQLISMIRFHNDQEIKTMRERMQMLQEDILSRMSRSKPSSSIRAPSKKPDYQWIIQENISLHGQYKSLNKH